MSQTFLDYINILKKEDLTTSILEYLLHDVSFANIFFNLLSIPNDHFETEPQKPIKRGFIDLFLDNNKTEIVLENKFDAPFTWNDIDGHQLNKYCTWLGKEEYSNKYLVILTIKRREKEVNEYIRDELNGFTKIKIYVMYWENLLHSASLTVTDDNINCVIQSLNEYIGRHFSKLCEILPEEMKMLNSKEMGKSFRKLEEMIVKIKESISQSSKFEISQPKKSLFEPEFGSIGIYFSNEKNKYWFGLNTILWSETGFPFYLQVLNIDGVEVPEKSQSMELKYIDSYIRNGFSSQFSGLNYIFKFVDGIDQDKLFKKILELAL